MSININNNTYVQSYNPAKKSDKTATNGFAIPVMKETHVTDESESLVNAKTAVDDYGIIQNHLRSQIQMLPVGIGMTSAELLQSMEERTAKIVFNFSEDGTVTIKEGLSQADYLRAKKALGEIKLWRQGK